MKFPNVLLAMLTCGLMLPLPAKDDQENQSKLRRVIDQTYETSINARVKVSNGQVFITKSKEAGAFTGEFLFGGRPPVIAYEIVGEEGRLAVKFNNSKGRDKDEEDWDDEIDISIGDLYDNECRLKFTDNLPLRLRMDLGVIRGDIDLGGLKISDCQIKSAVSDETIINFSEPARQRLEMLDIENGVGKLNLMNLCNANFNEFVFEAGVGSYVVDFGGILRESASADIEIGMGKMEILIPRSLGVRIAVDKSFFSSFDIDDVYKRNDVYYNDNWENSENRLTLNIDSGVAKITVIWTDE